MNYQIFSLTKLLCAKLIFEKTVFVPLKNIYIYRNLRVCKLRWSISVTEETKLTTRQSELTATQPQFTAKLNELTATQRQLTTNIYLVC